MIEWQKNKTTNYLNLSDSFSEASSARYGLQYNADDLRIQNIHKCWIKEQTILIFKLIAMICHELAGNSLWAHDLHISIQIQNQIESGHVFD